MFEQYVTIAASLSGSSAAAWSFLKRRRQRGSRRVSRIVEELSQAGLTCRDPDPDGGRGSYAVITSAGRRTLRSAEPIYLHGIAEHFTDHLDDRQLRAIHDALSRVVEAQEGSADPLPR